MGVTAVTTTIMFTDVVGSTALWERLGDAGQALRRAHDRILRQQFERFAGRVVKGTGDGFMVTFASARQGVECAVEVQRAMATLHAAGRYVEIGVRIGLNTGEPITEGDDLHGSDVDLAARIAAEAGTGEVLVSELTRMLARQTPGLEFEALGERTLKGFSEPAPVFAVRWPDTSAGLGGRRDWTSRRAITASSIPSTWGSGWGGSGASARPRGPRSC
jgi:class 3 adenylate cyclase